MQQLVAQLYFLDYKRDTPAFAMLFPLLGLTRDLRPLANAHAEHTTKNNAHPQIKSAHCNRIIF